MRVRKPFVVAWVVMYVASFAVIKHQHADDPKPATPASWGYTSKADRARLEAVSDAAMHGASFEQALREGRYAEHRCNYYGKC